MKEFIKLHLSRDVAITSFHGLVHAVYFIGVAFEAHAIVVKAAIGMLCLSCVIGVHKILIITRRQEQADKVLLEWAEKERDAREHGHDN